MCINPICHLTAKVRKIVTSFIIKYTALLPNILITLQYGLPMIVFLFKQLVQIIVRYMITSLVGIVFVSLAHLFIISALSNSFFSQTMILSLFLLMIPSVLLWHLIAQFSPRIRRLNRHVEIKSASITVVLVLVAILVWLPELTHAATIDIILYVGTFKIAGGLCGFIMDWIKTKKWTACRYINS